MLNNTEVSTAVSVYQKNAIDFMRRHGYILPSVIAMNKGKPLHINIKHAFVHESESSEEGDSDFSVLDPNELYAHGVSLKLNPGYSDKYLIEVLNKVAQDYQPDAIATISACLFLNGEGTEGLDIQHDPAAFRVIYTSYFLRGDMTPHYMVVPYTKKENPNAFVEDQKYIVHTFPCSWDSGIERQDLLIQYPY